MNGYMKSENYGGSFQFSGGKTFSRYMALKYGTHSVNKKFDNSDCGFPNSRQGLLLALYCGDKR